jgi:hypothetical protein
MKPQTEKKIWLELYKQRKQEFRRAEIELREKGFTVVRISETQYRINDCLDIFPNNKSYHDIVSNERGEINNKEAFEVFVKNYFGIK